MTDPIVEAATALANVLTLENDALLAMDFSGATRLSGAKAAALAALKVARDADALRELPAARLAQAAEVGRRLHQLTLANRQLLECAIQVQGRVLHCIAQAVPPAVPHGTRYGANGLMARARYGAPMSLSARV